jgi:hypothetical protein
MSLLDVCRRAASSGSGPSKNWRWPPSSRWSGAKQKCPLLAQGCRLGECSKVGRYLGYTGRAANVIAKAAFDPFRNSPC